MSESERMEGGNGARPGFAVRLDRLISALTELLATRSQILGRELSEKGLRLARGSAAAAVAVILGFLAFLLLAVLVAAIFARLFGSAWAGILAALVLYAAAAAAAALLAVREFGRVRPLDFPMTSREIGRDWEAVRQAAGVEGKPAASERLPAVSGPAPAADDFEERLRRGLE